MPLFASAATSPAHRVPCLPAEITALNFTATCIATVTYKESKDVKGSIIVSEMTKRALQGIWGRMAEEIGL